jgi:serpin B
LTGLHIADVTQKTFLAIGEKGTEAAAMTKVEMRDESAQMGDVEMVVDRPFTIVILDTQHSLISFMGYIQNPQP